MTLPLLWLPEALQAQGLTVKRVKGWETRGRPQSFDPRAIMFHHTASLLTWGVAPSLGICTNGRADLPGPLCNVLMARDGTAYMVAAGRCNHAGWGGPWRNIPKDSGNRYMAGVEVENSGRGEPWSADLLEACARCFAAFLLHEGLDASWLLGHKEWTDRKIDPSTSMPASRALTTLEMEGDDMGLDSLAKDLGTDENRLKNALLRVLGLDDRMKVPADDTPPINATVAEGYAWAKKAEAAGPPGTGVPQAQYDKHKHGQGATGPPIK